MTISFFFFLKFIGLNVVCSVRHKVDASLILGYLQARRRRGVWVENGRRGRDTAPYRGMEQAVDSGNSDLCLCREGKPIHCQPEIMIL